jgi:hypothetical protein
MLVFFGIFKEKRTPHCILIFSEDRRTGGSGTTAKVAMPRFIYGAFVCVFRL